MDWVWAFNKSRNDLFLRYADIFLTHVVVAKDITFFILTTLEAVWANLVIRFCSAGWLRGYRNATLLFATWRGCKWHLEGFGTTGEAFPAWWRLHCKFLRYHASTELPALGVTPVTPRIRLKHEEGLQPWVSNLRVCIHMQSFIECAVTHFLSSYKLTKACWGTWISGFSKKLPVYLVLSQLHRPLFQNVAWTRVVWVFLMRWSFGCIENRVLKRICSCPQTVISVSEGGCPLFWTTCISFHELSITCFVLHQYLLR